MPPARRGVKTRRGAGTFRAEGEAGVSSWIRRACAVAALSSLGACGGHGASSTGPSAPQNFSVAAGDGQVVVTWTPESDLQYWIFDAAGAAISVSNYFNQLYAKVTTPAYSPQIVNGLYNGVQYAFVMNATKNGGPAGPSTPSIAVTPRLAGGTSPGWTVGSALPATLPGGGSADFRAIVFGGGIFIAAGTGGLIYDSLDGTSWNPVFNGGTINVVPPITTAINALTYVGNLFIGVGDAGTVIYSGDGVNWASTTIAATNAANGTPNLRGIVQASTSAYVAVGDGGVIFTSTDLLNWTRQTSNTAQNLRSVANLAGILLVTGDQGTVLTSTDAGTWTLRAVPAAVQGLTLRGSTVDTYSAGLGIYIYAIVGDGGTILRSLDGYTWTTQVASPIADNLLSVFWGSRFVATSSAGNIIYSDDGLTWTSSTVSAPIGQPLNRVIFGNGIYATVGNAGANAYSR